MAQFIPAVAFVLGHEGDLEENPHDEGGITRWGISLRFYRQTVKPDASSDDIRNLSVEQAENIYKAQFWDKQRLNEIDSQKIANRMLDLSINCGNHAATIILQQAVNHCLNVPLQVDGIIGIRTIAAANGRPESVVYYHLIEMAKIHYYDIAKIGDNNIFLKSWLNRLTDTP